MARTFLDDLSPDEMIQRLELALDGAGVGVWDWDLRDDSVQFDRRWCEMLGLEHETTPRNLETWSSRVHPEDLPRCQEDIRAHLEGRTERYENLHRMRHADGRWISILDRGRISARGADGRPVRLTGTHTDVTALEAAKQERSARLATLALFAGGIAHEINSPLQVVLSGAELARSLLERPDPPLDQVREAVDVVVEIAQRAASITQALRALARDASDDPLREVVLAALVRHAEALSLERARRRGVRLEIADRSGNARVLGRAPEIVHALLNLVENGIDAASEGEGWVRVELEAMPDAVIVRVVDGGPGILPEHRARVLEPFFTTKAPGEGTGLGLGIAASFVERNGGSLRLHPQARPTTFVMSLPRVQGSAASRSASSSSTTSRCSGPCSPARSPFGASGAGSPCTAARRSSSSRARASISCSRT
jgi:PAS domain S-box-containing protein